MTLDQIEWIILYSEFIAFILTLGFIAFDMFLMLNVSPTIDKENLLSNQIKGDHLLARRVRSAIYLFAFGFPWLWRRIMQDEAPLIVSKKNKILYQINFYILLLTVLIFASAEIVEIWSGAFTKLN